MRMDMSTHIPKTKYKAASLSLKQRNSRVITVFITHSTPKSTEPTDEGMAVLVEFSPIR